MGSWERKHGRIDLPGIHDYYWTTPEHLVNDVAMEKRFIEPGVCGSETQLVRALRQGLGSILLFSSYARGRSTSQDREIQEIVDWIDNGMPK